MHNLGRYQIIEPIGSGAMGTVFKARDPMMGREVAIKTIHTHAIQGPQSAEFRQRFFREAQAAGRLAHPGIVTMYDVLEHEGTPFLVMEYVAGRTLQSILQTGERLDLHRSCELAIQIADALGYAHQNGVIHRDVKPANILLTADGRVKIADFGVAKLLDAQVTTTGQLLGTPAFMAPEQFTGLPLDARADLFAAGVVLYWMTTGDKPFTGDSLVAVQYKVVHTDPISPSKLNPAIGKELDAVITKSIAKNPQERYQTGEALASDLRTLTIGRSTLVQGALFTDDSKTLDITLPIASASTATKRIPATQIQVVTSTPVDTASTKAVELATPKSRLDETRVKMFFATLIVAIIVTGAVQIARLLQNKTAPQTAGVTATPSGDSATKTPSTRNAAKQSATAQARKDAATPPPPAPALPGDEITLALTAKDRTGVVFSTEGQPSQALTMKPGDTITLKGKKEATLSTSNGGALLATLNGKPITFGNEARGGMWVITPDGVDTARSSIGGDPNSRRPTGKKDDLIPGKTFPGFIDMSGIAKAAADAAAMGERGGGRNQLVSSNRQRELAQNPTSVRLLITSASIPEFLTLMVRVDGQLLYRRDASAPAPEGPGRGARRGSPDSPPGPNGAPLAEERLLPPGPHKIQVSVSAGTGAGFSENRELTETLAPSTRRTLNIKFGAPRGPERVVITLQ